jgi:hypothetical protein
MFTAVFVGVHDWLDADGKTVALVVFDHTGPRLVLSAKSWVVDPVNLGRMPNPRMLIIPQFTRLALHPLIICLPPTTE